MASVEIQGNVWAGYQHAYEEFIRAHHPEILVPPDPTKILRPDNMTHEELVEELMKPHPAVSAQVEEAIDFDNKVVKVQTKTADGKDIQEFRPKSKQARTIPLKKELAKIRKSVRRDSGYVIQPGSKVKRARWTIPKEFGVVRKAAGVTCNPHLFRHTFASWAAAKGVSIYKIQTWLGHSTAQPTADTDAHLQAHDRDACVGLKLDALDKFVGVRNLDIGKTILGFPDEFAEGKFRGAVQEEIRQFARLGFEAQRGKGFARVNGRFTPFPECRLHGGSRCSDEQPLEIGSQGFGPDRNGCGNRDCIVMLLHDCLPPIYFRSMKT